MSTTVGSSVSVNSFGTTSNATTSNTSGTGSATIDKNGFLKILMTQLKYQDPTNPSDVNEFTGQLSQLSMVEQLTNMATSLNDLKSITQQGSSSQWLSAIGKKILVEGNVLSKGDEIYISPSGDYDKVTLTLKSQSDGSTTDITFENGDNLVYAYTGTDTVIAGASATKDGKVVDCTLSSFRTVRGIQPGDSGMMMMTGDGKTYSASSIKLIKE
jgi:flagellar hook assembly protein FlgD